MNTSEDGNNNQVLSRDFINLLRSMRTSGLALICYSRCNQDSLENYRDFLVDKLQQYYDDLGTTREVVNTIIDHTQAPDSDFGSVSRRISSSFVDNDEIKALRAENKELKHELNELRFNNEIQVAMRTPFRSLMSIMIRIFKLAEKGSRLASSGDSRP